MTCLFLYVQKFFPSKGTVVWKKDTLLLYQINEFITEMGKNFGSIKYNFFETLKEKMQRKFRIPRKLVEYYE